ncbi:MAG: D-sedoheptulose 7-phosphate isomerase [Clostridiaceae bacterium]|nr:D-sedoheptulose 7-phosphate isomerase [Clostridiaceae bacterium]
MKDKVKDCFLQSIECKKKILEDNILLDNVVKIAEKIIEAYKTGHRVYICGNGGSAADSQHFAAELVGRFIIERKGLPATAFTTDSSILTAIGNDYGYDTVFKRQVEALVEKDDIFIVISTSGNSANLVLALNEAKKIGATTIGLLGKTGGKCKEFCDIPVVVDWTNTPNIQEAHITIIHIICKMVEDKLYEK